MKNLKVTGIKCRDKSGNKLSHEENVTKVATSNLIPTIFSSHDFYFVSVFEMDKFLFNFFQFLFMREYFVKITRSYLPEKFAGLGYVLTLTCSPTTNSVHKTYVI